MKRKGKRNGRASCEAAAEATARADQSLPPGGPVPIEEDPVWEEFAATQSQRSRDELIERYMPLVRQHAERLSSRLPPMVVVDDLIGAGSMGLIDAIEKFDHTRGIKFETYCAQRIGGAMLDDLRRYDWVPRLIRNKMHELDRRRDELESRLKRVASDEELAEAMNMNMDEYEKLRDEINVKSMVSLDRTWDDDGENETSHLDTLTDTSSESPFENLQREEIKELALRGLSTNEKAILIMYYYEEMSLKEIGAVLDISESRVCQIHQQTLGLLREKFVAREVHSIEE